MGKRGCLKRSFINPLKLCFRSMSLSEVVSSVCSSVGKLEKKREAKLEAGLQEA